MTGHEDRLMGCMAVEMAATEIYRALRALFPGEKDFWDEMISEEENHAKLFVVGETFKAFGEGKGQVSLPSMRFIEKTLKYAENVVSQLKTRPVSLEEALRMVLTLEESMVESYVYGIEADEDDSALGHFKKVLVEERSHVDRLRDLMVRKGFYRVS